MCYIVIVKSDPIREKSIPARGTAPDLIDFNSSQCVNSQWLHSMVSWLCFSSRSDTQDFYFCCVLEQPCINLHRVDLATGKSDTETTLKHPVTSIELYYNNKLI